MIWNRLRKKVIGKAFLHDPKQNETHYQERDNINGTQNTADIFEVQENECIGKTENWSRRYYIKK